MANTPLRPVVTFRIFRDEKCFGPGVAELLESVQKTKSLRQTALLMAMSYSKAWTTIKNSEKRLNIKLLTSSVGGVGGGGAVLTPEAEKILADYRAFEAECKSAVMQSFEKHFAAYK